MKKCKDCKVLKDESEFYTKYQGDCKECFRKAVHRYRLKNIDAIRAYDRKRNEIRERQSKEKIYELLGGKKCKRCGITDERVLQIDHVYGLRGKKRLRQMSKKIKEISDNPKDFQCLCANCNWIKRHENGETSSKYYKN